MLKKLNNGTYVNSKLILISDTEISMLINQELLMDFI